MKRLLIIFATTLALVATSPIDREPSPTCSYETGTYAITGSCGWDAGMTISAEDATLCTVQFAGAFTATAFGIPDGGRLDFEDRSTRANDAGVRLCAARELPDAGYEVICDRCHDTTANCIPDCAATFTP